ncbi:MAG TPA: preprotein translocase subunit SecG [Isosphaeraceae bacterium]
MAILTAIINVLLLLLSLFLICLVLIQRGKGGGLAGAFGGVGGSSAFGTKAGDVFTRITIIAAGIWIALNMLLVILANQRPTSAFGAIATPGAAKRTDVTPGGAASSPPTTKSGTRGPATSAGPAAPAPAPIPAPSSDLPSALNDTPAPATPTPAKTP